MPDLKILCRSSGFSVGLLGVTMAAAALLVQPAHAVQKTYVLEEHLNRTWRDQMLTYRFEAPAGACHPDSVRLIGPEGPMPVQLSQVTFWNETPFVQSANVSFYVQQLDPLTAQKYVLHYRPEPSGEPLGSALDVSIEGEVAEITSDRLGVRLLIGERTFDQPIAASDAPAPLQAVRMLDGTWTGKSSLYGEDARVSSYSARLTAPGPIFAAVETVYRFANGNVVKYQFRIPAGDRAIEVDSASEADRRESGWQMTFGGDRVRFLNAVYVSFRNYKATEIPAKLTPGEEPFAELSPWAGWWWGNFPTMLRLETGTAAGQIHLNSREAGAWVEPLPLAKSADFRNWNPGAMGRIWGRMAAARLPLLAGEGGAVSLRENHRQGERHWTISLNADGDGQLATYIGKDQTHHTPLPRLNEVKDMVLAWEDQQPRNPRLLIDAAELAAAGDEAKELLDVTALAEDIGKLGHLDMMRAIMRIAGRYDALINSDKITAAQRKLFRAQTAYLLYRLASPLTWSVERGYTSGNPNMSLSFSANAGVLALAMRDHPHSQAWIDQAVKRFDFWLDTVADEQGYWPESSHYARVSWSNFVHFGIAATLAGVRDYVGDPKFQKMAEFYEKTLTPGDPSRPTHRSAEPGSVAAAPRVNAPYGRGVRFDVWGLAGPLARAAAERYPDFSRRMRWSWDQTGHSRQRSHSPAGLDQLYACLDLPSETPDWSSEFFTNLGYLLRQHVGARDETYLLLLSRMARNADGEIWPADVGAIAKWFGHGVPLASSFPRGGAPHVMIVNRVGLAGNWDPAVGASPDNRYHTETHREAFAPLPALDYAHVELQITDTLAYGHDITMPTKVPAMPRREQVGQAPLAWHRQLLMVDDPNAGGPQYLVLRDTVDSPQPTQWHFWTLTEKLGTPQEASDREVFLADKPGLASTELRELKGDQFTGIGQYGVDVEYFIASPSDTPRYTLRYGQSGGAYGARGRDTYQDLMHLQMPGRGAYFVVLFPHRPDTPAPQFATEADGRIIRITAPFGEDLAFLHHTPTTATVGQASFEGAAGHIKHRQGGLTLSLAAPGVVRYGELSLASEHAAQLHAEAGSIILAVPANFPGGTVRIQSQVKVVLRDDAADVKLTSKGDSHTVTLPAGAHRVVMGR